MKKLLCLLILTGTVQANTVTQNCIGTELKVTLDDQTIIAGSQAVPTYKIEGKLGYAFDASNAVWVEQWQENGGDTTHYKHDHQTALQPYTKMNLIDSMQPYKIDKPGKYRNKLHVKIAARNCDVNVESVTTVIN